MNINKGNPITIRIHLFNSSAEAYEAAITRGPRNGIKTGDILHIPSEQVVGIIGDLPVAVSASRGALFHLVAGTEGERRYATAFPKSIAIARALASGLYES
jgi:hypothetical protein